MRPYYYRYFFALFSFLVKTVYILNGSLSSDIVVDSGCRTSAETFDVFGRSAGELKLDSGIQRVRIPQGGFLLVPKSGVE